MYAVRPDQLDMIDITNQPVHQVEEVQLTKCQAERVNKEASQPGLFIPKCDDEGNYEKKQCFQLHTIHDCWCVDENGEELDESRVAFATDTASASAFNCEKKVRVNQSQIFYNKIGRAFCRGWTMWQGTTASQCKKRGKRKETGVGIFRCQNWACPNLHRWRILQTTAVRQKGNLLVPD